MNKKALGNKGEKLAVRFLTKNRYQILVRNYSCRFGEIDIIARKKDIVAFVEVKLRKNDDFGQACEAVTFSKRGKIRKTAMFWLNENQELPFQPRFDIIEVYTESKTINHIENAFE